MAEKPTTYHQKRVLAWKRKERRSLLTRGMLFYFPALMAVITFCGFALLFIAFALIEPYAFWLTPEEKHWPFSIDEIASLFAIFFLGMWYVGLLLFYVIAPIIPDEDGSHPTRRGQANQRV